MAIRLSKYVRQGKKTFRFICMSGGVYDSNVAYEYGYFSGNALRGMRFSYKKYTEFEDDPDEKDGIGAMRPVWEQSVLVGNFLDGKANGFCYELKDGRKDNAVNFGIYEDGNLIKPAQEEMCPKKEFSFDNWEKMPVDPVDEDGFSVLRGMDYFRDGDLRYRVKDGLFLDGKLNGFGTEYYNSNVNGYHTYEQNSGVFIDGKLVFGYKNSFENTGGKKLPARFGYADGRDIKEYGEELIYDGKKYIGEAEKGVPCGIGCLFESDEKLIKGTFKNGKPHGICATYKRIDGEWTPYDFVNDRKDLDYYFNSWGIFADGEFQPKMTWEEFFEIYEKVKKV